MNTAIIELNDFDIRVSKGQDLLLSSPGYAYTAEDEILVGEEAVRKARLQPQYSHNRYWKNLNQDPLQYPSSSARHNADLAYAHLLKIHELAGLPGEVVFAVPGIYTNDQLALLLGLVEASPLKALAIVDSAVAATAAVAGPGNYQHIDLQLHQAVLTSISVTENVARESVKLIDGVGMLSIFDTTAHLISDLFINESRFDPQHHPETEQALYDQIPACLSSLGKHREVVLEIQYQQTLHQARITADALLKKLNPFYERINAAIEGDSVCLLSESSANLPGLAGILGNVEVLSRLNIMQACQANDALLHSDSASVNYITRLPAAEEAQITVVNGNIPGKGSALPEAAQPTSGKQPPITHVLHGHSAHSLAKSSLFLSASGAISSVASQENHCAIHVNGEAVILEPCGELAMYLNGNRINQDTVLKAGDIVSFTGSKTEYTFIHVSE